MLHGTAVTAGPNRQGPWVPAAAGQLSGRLASALLTFKNLTASATLCTMPVGRGVTTGISGCDPHAPPAAHVWCLAGRQKEALLLLAEHPCNTWREVNLWGLEEAQRRLKAQEHGARHRHVHTRHTSTANIGFMLCTLPSLLSCGAFWF